jgi:hypothetical protein
MSPCYDCPIHTPPCHSTCEKYKAYTQAQDANREARNRIKSTEGMMIEHHLQLSKRVRR